MNELKPEDVMKAVAWYEVVGKNIGSVTIPYDELQAIATLLREKDAGTEMMAECIKRQDKELAQKDAEIERLNNLIDFPFCSISGCEGASNDCYKTCPDSVQNKARAEVIIEFVDKLKERMREVYPADIYDSDIDQIAYELKGENE